MPSIVLVDCDHGANKEKKTWKQKNNNHLVRTEKVKFENNVLILRSGFIALTPRLACTTRLYTLRRPGSERRKREYR